MKLIDSPCVMAVGLSILGLTPREVGTVLGIPAQDVRDYLRDEGYDPDNMPTTFPRGLKDSLVEDAADAPTHNDIKIRGPLLADTVRQQKRQ